MSVTLMALFRRPDGGDEALETFRARYYAEHLPLMARVPGLRRMTANRASAAYGQTDLVIVTEMLFDDRAALDAAMVSDEMRAAGRNLREIAPGGMLTLLTLEPDAGPGTGPAA